MSGDKVRENDLIVKSYFCNVCSKVYAYKHTFQRHYYSIHGNNDGLNVYTAISVLNAMM